MNIDHGLLLGSDLLVAVSTVLDTLLDLKCSVHRECDCLGLWPLSILSLSSTIAKAITAKATHFRAFYTSPSLAQQTDKSLTVLVQSARNLLRSVCLAVIPLVLPGDLPLGRQPGRGKGGGPAGTDRVSGPPWPVDPDLGLSVVSNLVQAVKHLDRDFLGKLDHVSKGDLNLVIEETMVMVLVAYNVESPPVHVEMMLIFARSAGFETLKNAVKSGCDLVARGESTMRLMWLVLLKVNIKMKCGPLRVVLAAIVESDILSVLSGEMIRKRALDLGLAAERTTGRASGSTVQRQLFSSYRWAVFLREGNLHQSGYMCLI
jgi:hypothetical protein